MTIFLQQLKDQILSLNREIEERHSELEKLQQRRERENQEGIALIAMLKSDVDLSHGERSVAAPASWLGYMLASGRWDPVPRGSLSREVLNPKMGAELSPA